VSLPGATGPVSSDGAAAFRTRWLVLTLAAMLVALLVRDQVIRRAILPRLAGGEELHLWWLAALGPAALVGVLSGTRLATWRQLLGFAWASSVLFVVVEALFRVLEPDGVRARMVREAPPWFWVVGLLLSWWFYSIVFAAGMLVGKLVRPVGPGALPPRPPDPTA
jgi:hypothetical protein